MADNPSKWDLIVGVLVFVDQFRRVDIAIGTDAEHNATRTDTAHQTGTADADDLRKGCEFCAGMIFVDMKRRKYCLVRFLLY